MSNAFFLTRQSANLMEDFVREMNSDSSVLLLHGDKGVGKTRMLEELVRTRLGDCRIHWIDLQAGSGGDGALVDSSALIESVFNKAQEGDIIIADHFEMALKKSRHQLFLSWSTDGVDRKINMIVASNSDFSGELRQLARQYQVRAQNIRQKGMNVDEAEAFLGYYLFPDRPIGKLSIPPLLRNQLARAQGNIGTIIGIAERAGDQITIAPLDDTEPERHGSGTLVVVLIAAALVVVIGWYYFNSQRQQPEMRAVEIEAGAGMRAVSSQTGSQPGAPAADQAGPAMGPPTALAGQAAAAGTSDIPQARPAAVEFGDAQAVEVATTAPTGETFGAAQETPVAQPEAGVAAADTIEEKGDAPDEVARETEEAAQSSGEQTQASETESAPQLAQAEQSQPGIGEDEGEDTPAAEEAIPVAEAPAQALPARRDRLQRDLQASLDWIHRSDPATGTLQIMLLSSEHFDERVYYEHIDRLANRGIDIAAIRILRTLTGGNEVFSVVYGEYDSWKAANLARGEVPEALRASSPIARSVGSLLNEIRRLEDRN